MLWGILQRIASEKWMTKLLRTCHGFIPSDNDFEKFQTNEGATLPEHFWNNVQLKSQGFDVFFFFDEKMSVTLR